MSWQVVDVETGEPFETYMVLNDAFAGCKHCRGVHRYWTRSCKPVVFVDDDDSAFGWPVGVSMVTTPSDLIEHGEYSFLAWDADTAFEIVDSGVIE